MKNDTLPVVKKKKKINLKKFEALAKRVKKSFQEEEEYLIKKRNENSSPTRILSGY